MKAFGAVVSFELRGGFEAARRFLDRLELCTQGVSLGDVRTLVSHPASASHHLMPAEDRAAVGITDGLVRMSVGIEAVGDLQADLERALE